MDPQKIDQLLQNLWLNCSTSDSDTQEQIATVFKTSAPNTVTEAEILEAAQKIEIFSRHSTTPDDHSFLIIHSPFNRKWYAFGFGREIERVFDGWPSGWFDTARCYLGD